MDIPDANNNKGTILMNIPNQIQEQCRTLFKKDIQYAAALRIINRIYSQLLLHNSTLTPSISHKYVLHLVSNDTASKIIKRLLENDIIYVHSLYHADSHTARSYGLTYMRSDIKANRTIISVNIKDYLTLIQYSKYLLKTNVHLLSLQSILKDLKLRLLMLPLSLLLIERLKNVRFNKLKLHNYCRKYFPFDNPDTLMLRYTLSSDEDKRKKQLQYVYLMGIISGQHSILVVKGGKGGRLHHPLCHISKELWLMLLPIEEDEHKLSIDLNACQVVCLNKLLPLPSVCQQHLSNGTFYLYINERMYNNKKTRLQIKKIIFSQLFTGNKRFANKFSKISFAHKLFIDNFGYLLLAIQEQNGTLAALLQYILSTLFNKLYHLIDRSIVRYDLLVVIGTALYITTVSDYIVNLINLYFELECSLHISLDNLLI